MTKWIALGVGVYLAVTFVLGLFMAALQPKALGWKDDLIMLGILLTFVAAMFLGTFAWKALFLRLYDF